MDRNLALQEELRVRALAIENADNKAIASDTVFNMPKPNTRLDYAIKLEKLQKQIEYSKCGFVAFVISIIVMMVSSTNSGLFSLLAFYLMCFIGYTFIYLVMLIPRKMNITKCQAKIAEYSVDDVELVG